jgi:hypothetical protein
MISVYICQTKHVVWRFSDDVVGEAIVCPDDPSVVTVVRIICC